MGQAFGSSLLHSIHSERGAVFRLQTLPRVWWIVKRPLRFFSACIKGSETRVYIDKICMSFSTSITHIYIIYQAVNTSRKEEKTKGKKGSPCTKSNSLL